MVDPALIAVLLAMYALGWLTNRALSRRLLKTTLDVIKVLHPPASMTAHQIATVVKRPAGVVLAVLAKLEAEHLVISEWDGRTPQGHRRRYYRLLQWTDAL